MYKRNISGQAAVALPLVVLACISLIACITMYIYNAIVFDRGCEGYLKRAADANTVELAKKQLEIAVKYIEEKKLTSGFTSIWWTTPDEDVGFWYKNLKESLDELNKVSPEATQLEKSNVLMKLRETLLDQGQSTVITVPQGISVYPHNAAYWWWCVLSCVLGCIFFAICVSCLESIR